MPLQQDNHVVKQDGSKKIISRTLGPGIQKGG